MSKHRCKHFWEWVLTEVYGKMKTYNAYNLLKVCAKCNKRERR